MADTHYRIEHGQRITRYQNGPGLVPGSGKGKEDRGGIRGSPPLAGLFDGRGLETGALLGELIRVSEIHERMVDSLIRMVEPSASAMRETRSPPIVIDGEDEVQFLRKLLEGEEMAYFVYSTILDALTHIDSKFIGGERNLTEMRRVLGQLVSAEKRHRDLVSQVLAARSPP